MVLGVTPMTSAAESQLIFLAMVLSNASCSFIIRSTSGAGMLWLSSNSQDSLARLERTLYVLIRADRLKWSWFSGQKKGPFLDRGRH